MRPVIPIYAAAAVGAFRQFAMGESDAARAVDHDPIEGIADAGAHRGLPVLLHADEEVALVEEYLSGGASRRFYAIGEVGLDFYWSREWQREQEEAFRRQVEFSLRFGLPLVIHTREAWPEMLGLLREFRGSGVRGVMHAFSGTWEEYEAVKACGDFLFGIGGVVTYKKSTLPEVVSRMPLGDMVLETDAPYLPPVPYRGKRNEPAYIVHVCRKVAELKGIAPEEVAAATSANACRMFGI